METRQVDLKGTTKLVKRPNNGIIRKANAPKQVPIDQVPQNSWNKAMEQQHEEGEIVEKQTSSEWTNNKPASPDIAAKPHKSIESPMPSIDLAQQRQIAEQMLNSIKYVTPNAANIDQPNYVLAESDVWFLAACSAISGAGLYGAIRWLMTSRQHKVNKHHRQSKKVVSSDEDSSTDESE